MIDAADVTLGHVDKLSAPLRAAQLNMLVNTWDITPTPANSGALERYRTLPRALKNAFRLATAEGFRAYVIKDKTSQLGAVGIATIIKVNKMQGVNTAEVDTNYNLDYWLVDNQGVNIHQATAAHLIAKARSVTAEDWRDSRGFTRSQARQFGGTVPVRFFAIEDTENPVLNWALLDELREMSPRTAPLSELCDIGPDPYGIAMGGIAVRLHHQLVDVPTYQT